MNPRRVGLATLIVVFTLAATCLGAYAYWTEVEHRFLPVAEGRLYRSGEMPPAQLVEKVGEYGIRSVIDLRAPGAKVDAERSALEGAGVAHYNLHSSQVPSEDVVASYLDLLETAETPVLVHCEHGIGRAVLFSAIYRMEYEGWDNERARATAFWRSGLGSKFRPEASKGRFLLDYVPRRAPALARALKPPA